KPVGAQIPERLAPSGLAYYIHPGDPKLYALSAQVDPFVVAYYVMLFIAARPTMRLESGGALVCAALPGLLPIGWEGYFWGGAMARTARIPILIAFGCILLVGLGLVYDRTDEGSAFSWDVVSRGELRETIQASGEIQAKTRINIGTNVAGEIKAIHVRDGDEVRAGQALVTIDQVRLRQQLFQVEAALDASRKDAARLEAAMARSRQSARRSESLFTDGLISD